MPHTDLASQQMQTVARRLTAAERVLGVTHMNPDGDAVGSLVALGHIAASQGSEVALYCETPLPSSLNWLHSPAPILSSVSALHTWRPDVVVFLDCADAGRAGDAVVSFIEAQRAAHPVHTICIDHHVANPHFADTNWIDAAMCATGAMTALLAKAMGLPLAGPLGEAICLAIVSDTGSFRYPNTTALALELTAEIVRNGLSMTDFTVKYENHWTVDRMHLWGELMQQIRLLCEGQLVLSVVTNEILTRYGASNTDLEGYASRLRRLKGSKVALLARPGRFGCKISLRSTGEIDVQKIAALFGGGGHKGAAGIDMAEEPEAAAAKVSQAVCRALHEAFPGSSGE